MMRDWAKLTLGAILISLSVVEITCLPTDFVMSRSLDGAEILLAEPMLVDDEGILDREERYAASGSGLGSIPGYNDDEDITDTALPSKPEIVKLHVESTVSSRFASTLVTSKLKNLDRNVAEATFTMKLPRDAFISEFSMTIKDVVYNSVVMPKAEAQRAYNVAKAKGQTAGQVKQSSSDMTKFIVSVSVASHSSVIFNLTYQQLLRRKDGQFENRINIQPGQVVPDLRVDIIITEPQGLKEVNASWDLVDKTEESKLNGMTVINTKSSGRTAQVHFWSNGKQGTLLENGIMGELIVKYDVKHDLKGGNIQILNGYFVHYFSPVGLPNTRKNVVFVIDTSGSMQYTKMRQTKTAFNTILDDVRPIDKFNIVPFQSMVTVWEDNLMVESTHENITRAKDFVNNMNAVGGTNLHGGLMKAVDLLKRYADDDALPLIIMLTDGMPSAGLTNTKEIIREVTTAINGKISLICIAFGNDADYGFLESLSLRNQGLARKVYEDSSASLQLKGFYDEVANPLLFNIRMQYSSNLVDADSLTQSNFMAYYDGTEITVAGKLAEGVYNSVLNGPDMGGNSVSVQTQDRSQTLLSDSVLAAAQRPRTISGFERITNEDMTLNVVVSAKSLDVDIAFNTSAEIEKEPTLNRYTVDNFAQRLWAYLTINELLLERKVADDRLRKQELSTKALDLSLKYHFVTPLTSLLIVTPESNVSDAEQNEEEGPPEEADDLNPSLGNSLATYAARQQVPPAQPPIGQMIRDVPLSRPTSFADSDPHFVVEIPHSGLTVCFDINGRPGDIFNLLSDPRIDLSFSGYVISASNQSQDDPDVPTYFGKIGVRLGNRFLIITPDNIIVNTDAFKLPWDDDFSLHMDGFFVLLRNKRHLIISHGDDVAVVVLLHRVHGYNSHRINHLGLYIKEGKGLSDEVHGLIGQFQRTVAHLRTSDDRRDLVSDTANLDIDDRSVTVNRKTRRVPMTRVYEECWHAPDNANGLIEGVYTDYRLPSLTAFPSKPKF